MRMPWPTQAVILLCLLGCAADREVKPFGPIARFGVTPTIDGVFEEGEWDDAQVVQVGEAEQFRIKHDGTNLYFAFPQDGGNIYFDVGNSIQVLHASAQLGSARYMRSDSVTQSLDKAFDWQLLGLQHETVTGLNQRVADYLATNGWVASTGPLGNMAQAEWAVSLDWMGVAGVSKRYVETPRLFIFSARMRLLPEEMEALKALPPEERRKRYPPLNWPAPPVPNDSLNRGYCPETTSIDPSGWGTIWIDLEPRIAAHP